jgi:hypothetical protein
MTAPTPESLASTLYPTHRGAVRVIGVCTLLDALAPGWESRGYMECSPELKVWLAENNAHYYSAEREDFSRITAAYEAERAGKRIVVVEDLS